jgi:hypothetical protein
MIYSNGDKYEGEWKNDTKDGKGKEIKKLVGTYTYSNGDKYDGDWDKNKKSGKGSFFLNYFNRKIYL